MRYKHTVDYAILVADRSEAGRRPAASWNSAYHLARYGIAGLRQVGDLGPVCDQDSVMEFGLDQLRTGLRPGSSRFDIAGTCSNLVADRFEAKFQYAILVADGSEAGSRHVADLLAHSELDDRPNSSSLQVCDQPRTCLRPGWRNGTRPLRLQSRRASDTTEQFKSD